jgi:MOSC domain-containing protein
VSGSVAWISFTPVKGLRIQPLDEVELTEAGVPGDRAFFLVGADGAMISATRLGPLVSVVAHHVDGTLALRFPGGRELAAPVEVGEPEDVRFYSLTLHARPVGGPFSEALSEHCGKPVRMFAMPPERPGVDRGHEGGVTLLAVASLERLRAEAGATDPVDPRRFRMTFGVEGLEAHEEDGWIDRTVRVGDALVRVGGNVGRCAATTRNADTGVVDFKTLHVLADYRGGVPTTERLPFGVHARVIEPGRVRLGDAVAVDG